VGGDGGFGNGVGFSSVLWLIWVCGVGGAGVAFVWEVEVVFGLLALRSFAKPSPIFTTLTPPIVQIPNHSHNANLPHANNSLHFSNPSLQPATSQLFFTNSQNFSFLLLN
jgi:hypothetical protein